MRIALEFRFHVNNLCSSSLDPPPKDAIENVEKGCEVSDYEHDNHDNDHNLVVLLKIGAWENC